MVDELFTNYNLSDAEKQLISFSKTAITADISQTKVISELYSLKKTEKFVNDLIESNRTLSISNNRYALALNLLTGALVIVGIIQLFIK